jgi:hypothetical protein
LKPVENENPCLEVIFTRLDGREGELIHRERDGAEQNVAQ